MRKKNYRGKRCEKRKLEKCKGVFKSYDAIQSVYADLLVKRADIIEIRCNVAIGDTEYMTDLVAVKDNGELLVRECINRKYLRYTSYTGSFKSVVLTNVTENSSLKIFSV